MSRPGRKGRRALAFLSSGLLSLVSLLGIVALIANHRAAVRGIPPGLPEPIRGADVPPFCINAALHQYEGEQLDWAIDLIADGGFAWVRQRFPWADIEPTPGALDWTRWDRVVDAATARGLRLIAVLDTAPQWAGTPPPADAFARFAGAFAARYGGQIDHYQIWHNPNLEDGWGAEPDPAAYALLLRQSAEAIRTADPDALILLGSLAPTVETGPDNLSEVRFLRGLYAAGAAPAFDIVSAQPYGFHTGPEDRRVDEEVLNFSRAILLWEEMMAHGDGEKPVWASHFGWNSLRPGWEEVPSIWGQVDEATQAAYTTQALQRALEEWPWMGAMCLAHFQPDPDLAGSSESTPDARGHWGFAAVAPDGSPRPVFEAVAQLARSQQANYPGAYHALSGVAEWRGDWEFSDLGADPSQEGGEEVTIPFWGTDLGLRVRRGHYRAYLYVTIDGQPANALPWDESGRAYLVLTSPDYQPQLVTLPVAEGLPPGLHVATVTVERGWDQWPFVGWSVAYHPDETAYRWSLFGMGLVWATALILAWVTARRMGWDRLGRTVAAIRSRLSEAVQVAVTSATAAVLWAATWMTWGIEGSGAFRRLGDSAGVAATLAAAGLFYYSPWFLLTVLSGLVLLILIILRLDLGLALVAALAPFYGFPWRVFSKAFSMAEVVTLMSLVSWGTNRLAAWLERRRTATGKTEEGQPSRPGLRDPLDLAVLFLVSVSFISPFFADFKRVAWRELRLVILEPAAFYLMLRTSRLDRRAVWRVVDFFVAGGVAVAVIGLIQYGLGVNLITAEGGLPRLRSVYGSPNNVGLYLGRVLPVLLAVALFAGHPRRRLAYGLAALPVAAAILLSFSKGALLLGVPASLLTIGLLAGGRWLWATLAAVVAAGAAAAPLLRLPRFASLFDLQSGTTFFRLRLWQATLSMIRDHPWLGVGLDNFLYHYRGRYILPDAWQEPDLSHPHNWLLDHWARLGIFGVAAGVWLQIAFWRAALPLRRLRDPDSRALALGLMGLMADLLAHGLVDHSFFLIDLAFAFFLALAIVHYLKPETRNAT